jgi:hypothetical protein
MTTASHTMIARQVGQRDERRGHALMVVCALVIVLSALAYQWPPRALEDTTQDIQ